MKKTFLSTLLLVITALMSYLPLQAQETAAEGQSTEGKDFWVTFMQADQNDVSDASDKAITLALTISAQQDCDVTISNPFCPNATKNIHVTAGIKEIALYTGRGDGQARTRMNNDSLVCYALNSEVVDTCAIHVEATAPISLFASNRRSKSFDATNVLPTQSLLDQYLIQTIAPSDHGNKPQGTHFAIIATEDNTIVDYCPTVHTLQMNNEINDAKTLLALTNDSSLLSPEQLHWLQFKVGQDTLHSPVLMKGQVFYVWTGKNEGENGDLSGTFVRARDGKRIAVFQGAPHTNLPNKIRDRDHLFSQAVPTQYWGNTFVITSSLTRGRDIVRIMALEDGTEVRINGNLEHTFDFATNPKRTFEFEIGKTGVQCTDKDNKKTLPNPLVSDSSCFITTSCAAATHLFMVSNAYDDNAKGDPAMVWVNPIEQVINKISFATYGSSNTHYVNVVTTAANVASMTLDNTSIASDFIPVSGSNNLYFYARKNITYASHTLAGNGGFIAHVYGYGDKESYGYSAGGATKPLVQYVTINGQIFSPDSENNLCGEDTVKFACVPDYEFEKIVWSFGDGTPDSVITNIADSIVPHYYANTGVYDAKVCIYRSSSNLCAGQQAVSCIPIKVTIGRYTFSIGAPEPFCRKAGEEAKVNIPFVNESGVALTGDNVLIEFDAAATADGFTSDRLIVTNNGMTISVPDQAKAGKDYGIHMQIISDCGGTDTTMFFQLSFSDGLVQRFDNVLGLLRATDGWSEKDEIIDFQWYKNDTILLEGENNAVLNMGNTPDYENEYKVCFTINGSRTCSCPIKLENKTVTPEFEAGVELSNISAVAGAQIFVNALDEATADWYKIDGSKLSSTNLPKDGGLVEVPNERGVYILRVTTGKKDRNFKFMVF